MLDAVITKAVYPERSMLLEIILEAVDKGVDQYNSKRDEIIRMNVANIPFRRYVLASQDVNGLYNETEPPTAGSYLNRGILNSKIRINCDLPEAGKFLATNMTADQIEEQGFSEILPIRKSNKGIKLTMLGKEMQRGPLKIVTEKDIKSYKSNMSIHK